MFITLTVATVVTALIAYIFFWGDTADPGLGGKVTRFFLQYLPSSISYWSRRLLGERVHAWLAWVWDYVVNQRNPLLQLLYATLVIGGYGVVLWQTYPKIPNLYMAAGEHDDGDDHDDAEEEAEEEGA